MYRVVLAGLKHGVAPDQGRFSLATLFKVKPERVDELIAQDRHVVKAALDGRMAQIYLKAVIEAGGEAFIEDEDSNEIWVPPPSASEPNPPVLDQIVAVDAERTRPDPYAVKRADTDDAAGASLPARTQALAATLSAELAQSPGPAPFTQPVGALARWRERLTGTRQRRIATGATLLLAIALTGTGLWLWLTRTEPETKTSVAAPRQAPASASVAAASVPPAATPASTPLPVASAPLLTLPASTPSLSTASGPALPASSAAPAASSRSVEPEPKAPARASASRAKPAVRSLQPMDRSAKPTPTPPAPVPDTAFEFDTRLQLSSIASRVQLASVRTGDPGCPRRYLAVFTSPTGQWKPKSSELFGTCVEPVRIDPGEDEFVLRYPSWRGQPASTVRITPVSVSVDGRRLRLESLPTP